MKNIGLYIHIPFCKSKCPYCDFYSLNKSGADFDGYVNAVKKELTAYSDKGLTADTVYLGGGTPSFIGGGRVAQIVSEAKILFGDANEITVECNPSCAQGDFFKIIAESGVNRVSLGMQSAVDSERRSLGRLADRQAVLECIENARNAGIDNISLDIMLGIPGQTEKSFKETLDFCVGSGVRHISAYMLKIEENTPFYKKRDSLNLPDDDFTADMYLETVSFLNQNGFNQYEISNFAQHGFESRHNLKYWNCEEYLGIGPSAHSFLDGKRFFYPRDIERFMSGGACVFDSYGGELNEYIMLRLRLREGLIFDEAKKRYPSFDKNGYIKKAEELKKHGLVELDDDFIRLTTTGFLLSNAVISKIIY
ncbi:MAG: radical SAM family heme chaperone HemW [Acutalibacteraceae bacterium]